MDGQSLQGDLCLCELITRVRLILSTKIRHESIADSEKIEAQQDSSVAHLFPRPSGR